jgi:hypothetical protein
MRDEERLLADEERLETEQTEIRQSWIVAWFGVGLAVAVAIATAALVIAILAVRGDVGSIARNAPTGSVDTAALRDQSVTAPKLDYSAVGPENLASGAIGRQQLAADAVASPQVARNSLTGSDIAEGTLGTVPAAQRAGSAADAALLGGLPRRAFVSRIRRATASSPTDTLRIKGPLTALCPVGTRVISGGAAIEGAARGAAIVSNTPDGDAAWSAVARVTRSPAPAWRLVVTAVCVSGGR